MVYGRDRTTRIHFVVRNGKCRRIEVTIASVASLDGDKGVFQLYSLERGDTKFQSALTHIIAACNA